MAGEDRVEEFAEGVPVLVDLVDAARLRPEEDLDVADQVGDHKHDQEDAGDRHHPLLTHGRAVELYEEWSPPSGG